MANLNYNADNYRPSVIPGNGTRIGFTPNFPALRVEDVVVYVNKIPYTHGATIPLPNNASTSLMVSLVSRGQTPDVVFSTPPPSGIDVLVTLDGMIGNIAENRLADTDYNPLLITQNDEKSFLYTAVLNNKRFRDIDPTFTNTSPYHYNQRFQINPTIPSNNALLGVSSQVITANGRTRRIPNIRANEYIIDILTKTPSAGDVLTNRIFNTNFYGKVISKISATALVIVWFEFTHHFRDVRDTLDNQVNYRRDVIPHIGGEIHAFDLSGFDSAPELPPNTPNLDVVAPISARLIIQVSDVANENTPVSNITISDVEFDATSVNFTQLADHRGATGAKGDKGDKGDDGTPGGVGDLRIDSSLSGTGTEDDRLRVSVPLTIQEKQKIDSVANGATVGATTDQAAAIVLNTAKIGLSTGNVVTDYIGIRAVTGTRIAEQNITSNLIATNAVGLRALGTANAGAQGNILARGGGDEIEWIAPPQNESTNDFINAVLNSSDQLLLGRRNGTNTVVQLPRNQFTGVSISGSDLTLTRRDGNTVQVSLPSGGGGLATVNTDGTTISGDGSSTNPVALVSTLATTIEANRVKLNGIEANATQDQTNTQIRDSLQTLTGNARLDASAIQNLPSSGGGGLASVAHDATLTGLGTNADLLGVSNPFSQADEDKLDAIESNATADQTGTEIVTRLESLQGGNQLDATYIRNLPSSDNLEFAIAQGSWGQNLNLFIPATAGTYKYQVNNPTNAPTGVAGNTVVEVIRYGSNDLIQRIIETDSIYVRGGRGSFSTSWVEIGTSGVSTDTTISGTGTSGDPLGVANPFSSDQAAAIVLNTAKRSYPSTDQNKLSMIEDDATADQTGAEIRIALQALTGVNRLDASAIQNLPQPGDGGLSSVAHDATLTGLGTNNDNLRVANPFTEADETKLDNIAAGATIGATQAQIDAIAANTLKTGITTAQTNAITANTNKVGLTNGSVTRTRIADDAVDATKLSASGGTAEQVLIRGSGNTLVWGSAGTAQVADNAITTAKLDVGSDEGAIGEVLTRTATGMEWVASSGGGGGAILATDTQFNTGTSTTLAPQVAQVSRALDAVVPILSQWNGTTNPGNTVQVGPLPTVSAGTNNPNPYDTVNDRFEVSGNGLGLPFQSRLEWQNNLIDWKRTAFCMDTEQVAGNWQLITYFGCVSSPNNINQDSSTGGFGIGIFRPTSNNGNNYLFALTPYSGSGGRGEIVPSSYHNGAVVPTNSNIGSDLGGFNGFVITETNPRMQVLILRNESSIKIYVNRILRGEFTLSSTQNNRATGNRYGFFGDGGNNKLVYLYGLSIGNPPINLLDENCSILEPVAANSVGRVELDTTNTGTDGQVLSRAGDRFTFITPASPIPANGSIGTAQLADNAVTPAKLASAVTSAIAANTAKAGITTAQVNAIVLNSAKVGLTDGSITTARVVDNAITAQKVLKNSTLTGTGNGSAQLGVANDSIGVPQLDIVGTPTVDDVIRYNNDARLEWVAPTSESTDDFTAVGIGDVLATGATNLTLTRRDGSAQTVTIPTSDKVFSAASVSGNVITLTTLDGTTSTITLSIPAANTIHGLAIPAFPTS